MWETESEEFQFTNLYGGDKVTGQQSIYNHRSGDRRAVQGAMERGKVGVIPPMSRRGSHFKVKALPRPFGEPTDFAHRLCFVVERLQIHMVDSKPWGWLILDLQVPPVAAVEGF